MHWQRLWRRDPSVLFCFLNKHSNMPSKFWFKRGWCIKIDESTVKYWWSNNNSNYNDNNNNHNIYIWYNVVFLEACFHKSVGPKLHFKGHDLVWDPIQVKLILDCFRWTTIVVIHSARIGWFFLVVGDFMLYNVMLSFVGKFRREKTWRYTQILYFFCETLKFQIEIPKTHLWNFYKKRCFETMPDPFLPDSSGVLEFLGALCGHCSCSNWSLGQAESIEAVG